MRKTQLTQPDWISVRDRLPECDGDYFTISESLKGGPGIPIGTISIDTTDVWRHGKWYQDDDCWKVLYWARPVRMAVPEELAGRMRLGTL